MQSLLNWPTINDTQELHSPGRYIIVGHVGGARSQNWEISWICERVCQWVQAGQLDVQLVRASAVNGCHACLRACVTRASTRTCPVTPCVHVSATTVWTPCLATCLLCTPIIVSMCHCGMRGCKRLQPCSAHLYLSSVRMCPVHIFGTM
jgi:hypothetical protein